MPSNRHAPVLKQGSLLLALLAGLTFIYTSCSKPDSNTPTLSSITDLINTGSRFTLLKAALTRAGLDATLGQPGTYTVFAPSDDAFKAFGFADAAAINAAPSELLKTILQYHVLGSRLGSTDMPVGTNTAQQTLAGLPLYISRTVSATATSASSGTISVNGARIVQADGPANNGVLHAIDRILIPPAFGTLGATIQNIPLLVPTASFKLLQAAVTKTGTGTALTGTGTTTIFAPTDAAFRAVGYDSAAIAKAPAATLAGVLAYHLVNGRLYTPLITNGSSLTTLQGGTITAGISTTALTVTGKGNGTTPSNITAPDISASNGVVHIIDRLLLPQ